MFRSLILVMNLWLVLAAGCFELNEVDPEAKESRTSNAKRRDDSADAGADEDAGPAKPKQPAAAPAKAPAPAQKQQPTAAGAGGSTAMNMGMGAAGSIAAQVAAMAAQSANMQQPAATSSNDALPEGAEAIMAETLPGFGVGGTITFDFRPIILFKDGYACRDITFLLENMPAETHRNMYPGRWTKWKLFDGKVALQSGEDRWTSLDFQYRYPPVAPDFTLDGVFSRLTGGGNTAFGGDTILAVQSAFLLTKDHRFRQSASSAVMVGGAVAGSAPPDQIGSYEFDGYLATFRYDSGKTVTTTVVYTPQDPNVVFINGRPYLKGN